jgi:transketolase
VSLVVAAADRSRAEGIAVRCVSMPSWELFEAQPQSYRDEVLPPQVTARLAVELGVRQGGTAMSAARRHAWHRCVRRVGAGEGAARQVWLHPSTPSSRATAARGVIH